MTNQQKEKSPWEGIRMRDLLTHGHVLESHRNAPLEAIIHRQRTWCRPVQAQWCCCGLCAFVWTLIMLIYSVSFSWCAPSPQAVTLFPPPLPQVFLSSEGRDLMERSHLKAECSKVSHSLCSVSLWVSVFVPILFKRKLLCWELSEALICEYSRTPLGVNLSQNSLHF